jgi:hypothetical protein
MFFDTFAGVVRRETLDGPVATGNDTEKIQPVV